MIAEQQLTAKDIYEQYRRQIEHEDNLVSQRSSWVLMAQSFLVVGYCIMHQNAPPTASAQPLFWIISNGIAYVALITVVPILLGVIGSLRVMRDLNHQFGLLLETTAELRNLMDQLPPIQSRGPNCSLGQMGSLVLPIIFLVFWAVMILTQMLHT